MQAEIASARTPEEKEIARERRKAREAQAKSELHQAKAKHAAEKLNAKQRHYHPPVVGTHQPPVVGTHPSQPVGSGATMAGATNPTYPPPLGGYPPAPTYV